METKRNGRSRGRTNTRSGAPRVRRKSIRTSRFETLEERRLLAVVQWISDSDGDWSDAANWQDQSTLANRVPVSSDEVLIDRGAANPVIMISAATGRFFTVTSEETIVIAAGGSLGTDDSAFNGLVRIEGGSLFVEGGGAVTLSDVDWTAGSIGGTGSGGGSYRLNGTMTLSGADEKSLISPLTNNGTVIVDGTGNLNVSTAINNESGGVFDFQSDADFVTSTMTFNNRGILRKSSGVGESAMAATTSTQVNHFGGTVEVSSGKLSLAKAGVNVNSTVSTGATFVVGEGATLDLTGGNNTLFYAGAFTGSGQGRVELSAGSLDARSDDGVTFDFPDGLFHWIGGTIRTDGVGGDAFTNEGVVTLSSDAAKTLSGVIVNNDTIKFIDDGTFGGGTVNNEVGGVWDFQSDADFTPGVTTTFNNRGTLRKSGGVDESAMAGNSSTQVNHFGGTVEVTSGKLSLAKAGANVNNTVSTGATFVVGEGAVLDLSGGNNSLFYSGTYTGSGMGRVELSAGTLDARSDGGVTFDFEAGMFHWTGGSIRTDGAGGDVFTNDGEITLSGDTAKTLSGTLVNQGTILVDGNGMSGGGTIENNAGAVWDFRSDADIAGTTVFNNRGTLRKSGGTDVSTMNGSTSAEVNHLGGTVDVTSGTLALAGSDRNHLSEHGATFTVAAGATLDLTGGNTTTYFSGLTTGTGQGRVELSSGTLRSDRLGGSEGADFDFAEGLFQWTGGAIFSPQATPLTNVGFLTLSGAETKTLSDSYLVNEGTLQQRDAGIFSGGIASAIDNRDGALWDFQTDTTTDRLRLINAGTVRKSGGDGESIFGGANSGLAMAGGSIEAESGRLKFDGVANVSGVASTGGALNASAEAVVELAPSNITLGGTYTGSGSGRVELTTLINGNTANPPRFDFPEGLFHWVGNENTNSSGIIFNDGFITLEGPETVRARAYITNSGTVVQEDGASFTLLQTSAINNNGLWDIRGDGSFQIVDFSGIGSTFNNFGELRKSAGAGTSNFFAENFGATSFLNNVGVVNVQSGSLEVDAQIKQLNLTTDTLQDGTWRVGPSSTLRFLDSGDNDPPITSSNADIILDGTSSEFPNIAGIASNGGLFELQGGRDFSTTGDLINGVERFETQLLDYFNVDFLSGGIGRLVGIAADATTGTVITHSRNDRNADLVQIFREYDSDGRYLPPPILQPGGPVNVSGIDLLSTALNVGGTDVPPQSMLFVHGNAAPPTLYALDKETGVELASVLLTDLPTNISGIAHHPVRGSAFAVGDNEMIYEINATDGSTLNSFSATPSGAPFFSISWGGLDVRNSTGNLYVIGSGQKFVRELTPTGEYVRDYDLTNFGTAYEIFSDISFNDANEDVWITSENGLVYHFAPFEIATIGAITLGSGSELTVNGDFTDTSTNTINIEIGGRPATGGFGKLEITGNADLGGTINVELADGFGAVLGDAYQIVTYASRSGDDPTFTGLDPFFQSRVESTQVVLDTVATASDLAIDANTFAGPAVARPGEAVEVSFTVENVLSAEASGPWVDSAFLSRDRILSADDMLIGTATRSAPVPGNDSYIAMIAGRLPAVIEGDWYLIGVADAGRVVADVDRNNNVGIGAATLTSEIPMLTIGSQIDETLQHGQSRYYRVDIPAGSPNVLLEFDAGMIDGSVEMFIDRGRLPTRSRFSQRSEQFDSPTASIQVNDPSGQPVYVLVYGRDLSSTVDGQLAASIPPLIVDRVTQQQIGNEGTATVEVFGSQLSASDTFELISGGQTVNATSVVADDSGQVAWIQFDVDGATLGDYDLQVTQQNTGTEVTLASAVEIVAAQRGELSLQLLTPGRFRNVRVFAATLVYENTGNVDMPAPVITIVADNAKLNRFRGEAFVSNRLMIIGASQTGEAGILRPGARFRTNFRVLPDSVATLNLTTMFATSDSQEPIDWDEVEQLTRPPGIPDEEWDRFFVPFTMEAGDQWSSYVDLLSQTSTWVQRSGGDFLDGPTVLNVAQRRAFEDVNARIAGVLSDATGVVSGATLLASNLNDSDVAGTALSRWDGSYVFTNLPDGTYAITIDGYRLPNPVEVEVTNGSVSVVNIDTDQGAGLAGTVLNSSDASTIAGATVSIISETGERQVTQTDGSAAFLVTGLTTGAHDVVIEAPGFGSKLISNLELTDGSTTALPVELDAASQIVGRLSSTIGVTEAETIIAENQFGQVFLATPDSNGNFAFDNLPVAEWTLSIDAPGHLPTSIAVMTVSGSAADVGVVTLTPADPLQINVIDAATGLLITDAWVEIQTPTGEFLASGPTGENGTFVSTKLSAADFNIVASAPGFMINAVTFNEGDTPLLNIELAASGIISGNIVDEDANPIVGIPVQLLLDSQNGPPFRRSTVTDANGDYEFAGLSAATFGVAVGNDVGLFRQDFVISAQDSSQTYDIVVPGSTISGVLLGSDAVTPVEDATVLLIQSGAAIASATTNAAGEYIFRVLQAGDYDLTGSADDGITSVLTVSVGADEDVIASTLTLGALSFTLNVSGVDGQPASGGFVTLNPEDAANILQERSALSDSAGVAQVSGLVPGDYTVTVFPPDGISYWFDVSLSSNSSDNAKTPAGQTVSGTVQAEADSTPVEAELWLYDASKAVRASVIADENGNYQLPNVPSGDYRLVAFADEFEVLVTTLTVTDSDLSLNLDLVVQTTAISGTVSDESAAPVSGAEITIQYEDGVTVANLTTDFDGNWSTAALPVGDYTAFVARLGFRPEATSVTVTATPNSVTTSLTSVATDDSIFVIPFLADELLPAISAQLSRDEATQEFFRREQLIPNELARPPELPNLSVHDCAERIRAWIAANNAKQGALRNFRAWEDGFEALEIRLGASRGAIMAKITQILAETTLSGLLDYATAGGSEAALSAATLARLTVVGGLPGLINLVDDGVQAISFLASDIRNSSNPWRALLDGEATIAKVSNGFIGLVDAARTLGSLGTFNLSGIGIALNTLDGILTVYDSLVDLNRAVKDVERLRDNYRNAHANWRMKRIAFEEVECPPCEQENPPTYCDPPPPPPPDPGPRRGIGVAVSSDPNDKLVVGFGDQGHVRAGETITYSIRFENMPTADVPAQEVFVSDFLSDKLDWSTIELTAVGFNNVEYDLPERVSEFEGRIDVPTDSFPVDATVTFDTETGELHWYMRSVDPLFDGLPEVPEAGFLPPNDETGRGEGFLVFRARVLDSLTAGEVIENNASIVFDDNQAIVTNTTVTTIDDAAPMTAVTPLDEAYGTANFMVDWSGQDNDGGSGIASYDLYVSRDEGPFERLLANTAETSYEFNGVSGSSYGFVTVARDNVGNVEAMPMEADTQTLVIIGAWTNRDDIYDVNGKDGVTALDALVVIQELGRRLVSDAETFALMPLPPDGFPPPFYDVTEDGKATALDALRVINQLARLINRPNEPDGEAVSLTGPWVSAGGEASAEIDAVEESVSFVNADLKRTPNFNASQSSAIDPDMASMSTLDRDSDQDVSEWEATLRTLSDDVSRQWALGK